MPPRVVLLGAGHTHTGILTLLRAQRRTSLHVTLVSDQAVAAYSGMLPAVMAGQYPRSLLEIDLAALCASAGAEFVIGQVSDLDLSERLVRFIDGRSLPFDILSIGIGSVPSLDGVSVTAADRLVPTKPMQTFMDRLDAALTRVTPDSNGTVSVCVVGGGLGGIEIACALASRLGNHDAAGQTARLTIVTRDADVSVGMAPGTARKVTRALAAHGISLITSADVTAVDDDGLGLADGRRIPSALAVWAASAAPPPLVRTLGLPQDARGFLLTDSALRAHVDPPVFAVGDAGSLKTNPSPKAGVYAVRQVPVLWHNINAVVSGRPLCSFTPQRSFLRLINVGDGRAISEWKGLSFEGRWVWWLKNHIDRRFMSSLRQS